MLSAASSVACSRLAFAWKRCVARVERVVAVEALAEEDEEPQEDPERGGETEDALLRILKPGAYFGERALLADEPRSATVEAVSAAECLRVDKAAFF